ncbi:MAG TPA: hypothetical protein VMS16_00460 [Mycobacterium sp.]|nr:hypothetical protein [Mycobacterium sp.]
MKRVVVLGLCAVVAIEMLALLLHDRRFVLWTSGVAVAVVLLQLRHLVSGDHGPASAQPTRDVHGDSLRSWLSRTEKQIRWSESTRADWDRRLRPILAGRYETATRQRQSKDPAAYHATGRMLFGPTLWEWVNPENVSSTGASEPGPGREVLEEILQRLEQV